jgi:aspartyl-tRNA(Asn)/glutamyl-tRNA(Gln) amidotransferase subunit A
MDYSTLSAGEIQGQVARGEVSAEEICRGARKRIAELNPKFKIFLAVDEAGALEAARLVDKKRAAGEKLGALAGVPVALKDNMVTKGFSTTCASKILDGWKPPYDATVVERLHAADAVLMGKTNMDEFAMGSSCENSAFHPTYNPWNPAYVVGGSSGGSAAAVAAGLTPLALGSDTGGSIRQPAALCGVMGFKPTYGRVSRYGLMAFASSLDQIGPFARTAEDTALLMSVISGHDERDSTSATLPVPDYAKQIKGSLKGLKVGLPKEYYGEGLDPEVGAALAAARRVWEEAGAEFVDVSLPHTQYCLAVYYLVATAEASSNLARYDGVQYGLRAEADNLIAMYGATRSDGFGPEVKRRIMLGTYALSAGYYDAYYKKALQVRTLIQRDFNEALKKCDMIFTPTSPTPAFKLGEKLDDPLTMYLSDIYTISVNLAGLPGLSLPCGLTKAGLPIGLQLIGKAFDETALLRAAQAYQTLTDWHSRRPAV